jgi:indole-3-glycerol phosphate synthase
LNATLDPADLAMTYEDGGAECLSVLTDRQFFGGSATDLTEARAVTKVPVLRKDFTVAPHDVCDARLMGADCVLLIAAALSAEELRSFHALATEIGLDALVEVHDERELEVALGVGATLVGVNQRDLVTFEVDNDRAARMAAAIPDGIVKVAESGVRGGDDARALHDAGYHAVLVGETLVTATDPIRTIHELKGEDS